MPKVWKQPQRNWNNIQFEKLRRKVDSRFNAAHDALSSAYYNQEEFIWRGKNWGILDKKLFDKLHGLIFHLRALAFHASNKALPPVERIPEEEYNDIIDESGKVTGKKMAESLKFIHKLKDEKIELEI